MKMRRIWAALLAVLVVFSLATTAVAADNTDTKSTPLVCAIGNYTDVSEEDAGYEAVQWAVEHGIVYGVSRDSINPDADITNGQMLVMISRAAGFEVEPGTDWWQEIDVRVHRLIMEDLCSPYMLGCLNEVVSYSSAAYWTLRGMYLETWPYDPAEHSMLESALVLLQDLGLADANAQPLDKITRGEFIELLYKVHTYDFLAEGDLWFSDWYECYDLMKNNVVFASDEMSNGSAMQMFKGWKVKRNVFYYLDRIPRPVLEEFVDRNWTLRVGWDYVHEYFEEFGRRVAGVTDYTHQKISVAYADVIEHEFGHFLQYAIDRLDSFDEYYEEGRYTLDGYKPAEEFIDNTHEYFAECFEMYLDYQFEINVYRKALAEQMKESAPKTWAFFEELNATGWIPG